MPDPLPVSKYEKLGVFYLGRAFDPASESTAESGPLLYDSRDLVTHAVCVGMTGSGKTGLGIGLIEEAAIDGVPALVVDPKGDLTNLLLTFPELRPEDFRPWVNADDAGRSGQSLDDFAADQAELWRSGLAGWGQDGDRIRRLRQAADFSIYTPGSEAGLSISVLASFAAPAAEIRQDPESMRERVGTTVSSLLTLMDLRADPIQSREHILLSTLLERAWSRGEDVDLAGLIRSIQDPPLQKVGVLDLETFYPARERASLALRLNNLLASPSFQGWMQGESLDIGELLYTSGGQPRVAVISIAHLPDSERMFFVSLLLNELVSWMRSRPGTTSLRALLYMDEIFGFMPPIEEPPSKRPLLTLLKQARAYGVGVVLATQNPVDLDYKGLSNAGTWFVGRLQTKRDKMRLMEGLRGANPISGMDESELERTISDLGKRQFLLHNVHEDRPALFETRWVMSYLRGPLTRNQIRQLMRDRKTVEPPGETVEPEIPPPSVARPVGGGIRPVVEAGVEELFQRPRFGGQDPISYSPHLLGRTRVHFVDRRTRVELAVEEPDFFLSLTEEPMEVDWALAREGELAAESLHTKSLAGAEWQQPPPAALKARSYSGWAKQLSEMLYRSRTLDLFKSPTYKITSAPGESEKDFRVRLADTAREQRDAAVEKLRERYANKTVTLEDRLRRARARVEKEKEQASREKLSTAVSVGSAILSILTGRKGFSKTDLNRAGTAMRGVGRAAEQSQDVGRAEETVTTLTEKIEALNRELESEIEQIGGRYDPESEELEVIACRPRRSDVVVRSLSLLWIPDES
jgi:hypothetical protein